MSEPQLLTHPLIVVSDVHLKSSDDDRAQLLIDTLGRVDPNSVEHFVLLGDIFDFCFGANPYYSKKFAPLGKALSDLKAQGVAVTYFEGNHEFDLYRMGWDVDIIREGDRTLTLKDGTRIKFAHGDLIVGHRSYLLYRGLVRSTFTRVVASRVPARWLDAWALNHAKNSRERGEERPLNHTEVLEKAEEWVEDRDYGIFGHYHVPYCEQIQGEGHRRLLSVECWDRPNLLLYNGQSFDRAYLDRPGAPYRIEAATDTSFATQPKPS